MADLRFVIASSGENAIDLLDVQKVDYRAVVTDINLGRDKIDGWDVARRAREINAGLPVVYMTGDSADDWTSKGVPNSILLTKPFAPAQLLTAVSQLLNSGTPTTSAAHLAALRHDETFRNSNLTLKEFRDEYVG